MPRIDRTNASRLVFLLAFCGFAGCGGASGGPSGGGDRLDATKIAELQERLVLDSEPPAAKGVLDLRESLQASDAGSAYVVVGKIGGMPNPFGAAEPAYPWVEGRARFYISDENASTELGEHVHVHADGEECHFCKSAARSEAVLLVDFGKQFEQFGAGSAVDARTLFDLSGGETVVVRGTAIVRGRGESRVVVFQADGIFIRR